jgi:hypothetical protein
MGGGGRIINPQSSEPFFASTSPTAGLNIYNVVKSGDVRMDTDAVQRGSGTGGSSATLHNAVFFIIILPELQSWVMFAGALTVCCLSLNNESNDTVSMITDLIKRLVAGSATMALNQIPTHKIIKSG